MAEPRQGRPRPLESARCSLCGIELPKALMTPDGGEACDDIRWYCKDSRSCTERWTSREAEAHVAPSAPSAVPAPSATSAPVPAPAPAPESQPAGGA
jgi:hypothetical protein